VDSACKHCQFEGFASVVIAIVTEFFM